MIVVSDTTPLISMMKAGKLEIIHKLFGMIRIPGAVFDELVCNNRYPEESLAIKACPFIESEQVLDTKAVEQLRNAGLDLGESEAIVLSGMLKSNILLMDELKGRKIAQQMGIPVMGTIGILMAANEDGFLSKEEVLNCITALKRCGRHISEKLYEQLISRLNN